MSIKKNAKKSVSAKPAKKVSSKKVGSSNGWKYSFTNLDKYDASGAEYKYRVKETAVTVTDNGTAVPYKTEVDTTNANNFINTELTEISGQKQWNGSDTWPDSKLSVTFQLKQDGSWAVWYRAVSMKPRLLKTWQNRMRLEIRFLRRR